MSRRIVRLLYAELTVSLASAVVVDVGISRMPADNEKGYVIRGDVKFDEVAPKCYAISPVPGGVGLMTVASLLMNTMKACRANG